ncbi:MAG TPA: hypothetical protein VNN25_22990 [Thermoanaerobaculia bacterium]|nr:hypothetical protein [Thermoanaerobaculia bacterium]
MTRPDPDLVLQRADRKRLKSEYSALFEDLSALLYQVDPARLNFGINPDEYEPEAGTILPRVMELETASEIESVIREELERWFGGGTRIEKATYEDLGAEVLALLNRYRSSS